MSSILSWGQPPKLIFKNEEEFYRTLGQVSNETAFNISFEPNKNTGSYSDAYRIRVLKGTKNITGALQNKLTTNDRINCNDYVKYLIQKHAFVQSGNAIMRSFKTVLETIPEEFKLIFIEGYNEVASDIQKQVFYATDSIDISQATLTKHNVPKRGSKGKSSRKKQGKRDYIKQAIDNYEIGEAGERIVYEYELAKLKVACEQGKITSLKDKLEWVSRTDDSIGYDIRSYDIENKKSLYIEVKTTVNGATTPFYMSENELEQSRKLAEQYVVYRLYGMDRHKPKDVKYFILQGDIRDNPHVRVNKMDEYQVQIIRQNE